MGFSQDTEVYTIDGWKELGQLAVGDKILSPLSKDKGSSFVEVASTCWQDRPDRVVRVQATGKLDIIATENQCIVSDKLVIANNLPGTNFKSPCSIVINDPANKEEDVPIRMHVGGEPVDRVYNKDSFFKLSFLFPFLGKVDKPGSNKQKLVFTAKSINPSKKKRQLDVLVSLVNKLQVPTDNVELHSGYLVVKDKVLAGFMKNISNGAHSKIPVDIIDELTFKQAKDITKLIDDLVESDLSTYSSLLADQYQLLYLLAQRHTHIKRRDIKYPIETVGMDSSNISKESIGKSQVTYTIFKVVPHQLSEVRIKSKNIFTSPISNDTDMKYCSFAVKGSMALMRRNGAPFLGRVFHPDEAYTP